MSTRMDRWSATSPQKGIAQMLMSEVLDHVVHPTLIHLSQAVPQIHSIAACRLVTCTAHVESLGDYLSQIGGGPARGIFQIEPSTALDIIDRYLPDRDALDESPG